ncbi:MFS transporter [Streptomyces albofaciens JCM 4342]|uniref:MFS transporter n=1 Tax=Streptomyces albofaciens TaxID=66866 RepID=UPI00123AD692|nr:MFS transporter [Streptomyces albofaciens]KAA6213072.1 MFS transporter [Streptomyces albofaciens JCM 4342]
MGGTTLTEQGRWEGTPDTRPVRTGGDGPPPDARRTPGLPVVLPLALLPAALGPTVAVTALPEIAADLRGPEPVSWLLTAFLFAAAAGLPLHARLGEVTGRRAALVVAALLFTAGSVLAGRAHATGELTAFRALQGAGAGGLVAGVHAVLAALVPPGVRRRTLGVTGTVCGLVGAAGPLLGGYLTDHASWRWCFFSGVPFGVLALLVTAFVPKLPRPAVRPRADLTGALLLAACATCLLLLADWGGTQHAWTSRTVLGLGLGALGTALLFVAVEYFATDPLLPLHLFRDAVFAVTGLVGAALGAALFGIAGYLPTFLPVTDGASPTRSGLLMLPLTAGLVLGAALSGHLVRRTGRHRVLLALGCALAGGAMWLLCRVPQDAGRPVHSLGTGVLGLGVGCVLPALVLAVRASVRRAGPAPAPGATLRRLGGSVAAGLFATFLADRLAAHLVHRPAGTGRYAEPEALVPGLLSAVPAALHDGPAAAYAHTVPRVFLYLLPVLLLGLLLAVFRKENPLVSHTSHVPPAPHAPLPPPAGPREAAPVPHARTEAAVPRAPERPDRDPAPSVPAAVPSVPAAPPASEDPSVPGVPVCGTVRHRDGSTVPCAALTLIDTGGRQVGRGATGDDGRYALSTPGPGAYVLIAAAGGHRPQAVAVSVGERPVGLDVVLGGAGRLAGAVTTADGVPVRDATVTLTDVRGEVVATARSGREGGYVLTELVAGDYTLAVSAPGYRPTALPVTAQAARETRQDIELSGGAVLRGTVRAGDGRPVGDARVTLLDAAGNVVDTATTGPDGLFRFVDLSAGEYTVIAAGYPPVATVLQVTGGGRTERDLQLGHGD